MDGLFCIATRLIYRLHDAFTSCLMFSAFLIATYNFTHELNWKNNPLTKFCVAIRIPRCSTWPRKSASSSQGGA